MSLEDAYNAVIRSGLLAPSSGTARISQLDAITPTSESTLYNKNLDDKTTLIIDDKDATKRLRFELGALAPSTTYIINAPSSSGTMALTSDLPPLPAGDIVGTTDSQTLSNKSINGSSTNYLDFTDTYILSMPTTTANDEILVKNEIQKVYNKSFSDANNYIINSSIATKRAKFDASTIDIATDRTYTLPNQDGTLALTSDLPTFPTGDIVGTTDIQSISNKSFNGNNAYRDFSNSYDLFMPTTTSSHDIATVSATQTLSNKSILGTLKASNEFVAIGEVAQPIRYIYGTNEYISEQLLVGANDTFDDTAGIEIRSTSKGLLLSRLTDAQESVIFAPPNGLMLYNTDIDALRYVDSTGAFRTVRYHDYEYGHVYITTPIETNISAQNVYIKVAGTTTDGALSGYITTGQNRLINNGVSRVFKVDATITAITSSGSQKDFEFLYYLDGTTPIAPSCQTVAINNKDNNIVLTTIITLLNGQYLEVWVRNTTDATKITITNMSFLLVSVD